MITVYVFANAPQPVRDVTRDLRALWALEEAGLPYRIERLDYERSEHKGSRYTRIHPFGQIPAIDDDGFTLFESAAIVLHVAEKADVLLPQSRAERALATQWTFAAVNTVEPPVVELFTADAFFSGQSWVKERRPAIVERVKARLAALEGELAQRPYLVGTGFTAADILMATVLRLVRSDDLLAAVPKVAAYLDRCTARPAWGKVIAEHRQRLAA
jgi:glutathione S-transferase